MIISLLSRYTQCVLNQVDMTFLHIDSRMLDTIFHGAHFLEIFFALNVQVTTYMVETSIIPIQDICLSY